MGSPLSSSTPPSYSAYAERPRVRSSLVSGSPARTNSEATAYCGQPARADFGRFGRGPPLTYFRPHILHMPKHAGFEVPCPSLQLRRSATRTGPAGGPRCRDHFHSAHPGSAPPPSGSSPVGQSWRGDFLGKTIEKTAQRAKLFARPSHRGPGPIWGRSMPTLGPGGPCLASARRLGTFRPGPAFNIFSSSYIAHAETRRVRGAASIAPSSSQRDEDRSSRRPSVSRQLPLGTPGVCAASLRQLLGGSKLARRFPR